jgi:hypothetical protein
MARIAAINPEIVIANWLLRTSIFVCRKFNKISENNYHNKDPWLGDYFPF